MALQTRPITEPVGKPFHELNVDHIKRQLELNVAHEAVALADMTKMMELNRQKQRADYNRVYGEEGSQMAEEEAGTKIHIGDIHQHLANDGKQTTNGTRQNADEPQQSPPKQPPLQVSPVEKKPPRRPDPPPNDDSIGRRELLAWLLAAGGAGLGGGSFIAYLLSGDKDTDTDTNTWKTLRPLPDVET